MQRSRSGRRCEHGQRASNAVLDIVTAFIKEKDVSRAISHLAEDVRFDGPLLSVRGRREYRGLLEQFLSAHIETRVAAAHSLREAVRCARNEHERSQIEARIFQIAAPTELRKSRRVLSTLAP